MTGLTHQLEFRLVQVGKKMICCQSRYVARQMVDHDSFKSLLFSCLKTFCRSVGFSVIFFGSFFMFFIPTRIPCHHLFHVFSEKNDKSFVDSGDYFQVNLWMCIGNVYFIKTWSIWLCCKHVSYKISRIFILEYFQYKVGSIEFSSEN